MAAYALFTQNQSMSAVVPKECQRQAVRVDRPTVWGGGGLPELQIDASRFSCVKLHVITYKIKPPAMGGPKIT